MLRDKRAAQVAVAIAGAGPVAQAFGRALCDSGTAIAWIASRNLTHARSAAEFISATTLVIPYAELASHASHVLIAVSDGAIEPVARELARSKGKLRVALHTCGSYGREVLRPLAETGVACGAIHPLQTIQEPARGAAALRMAAFSVSGDPPALEWAEQIAATLSGRSLHIRGEARTLYHAAAVMASNYIAAVLHGAEELMLRAGVPESDALHALAPLARASLENVFRCGPVEALTGPVSRGDAATVTEHTRALGNERESIAELYRAAGLHALQMAKTRGLGDEDATKVHDALVGRR